MDHYDTADDDLATIKRMDQLSRALAESRKMHEIAAEQIAVSKRIMSSMRYSPAGDRRKLEKLRFPRTGGLGQTDDER